jgi:hypothetical protein
VLPNQKKNRVAKSPDSLTHPVLEWYQQFLQAPEEGSSLLPKISVLFWVFYDTWNVLVNVAAIT